jgi:predicted N-acetyltransferase YhbS
VIGFAIEKLNKSHAVADFDCGTELLNRYLVRYALTNQQAKAAQTYVALVAREVAGFYTLAVGQVEHEDAAERLRKGLARHPVPVMVLARLAVARGWQGKRLGAELVRDAIKRTLSAAEIAGIRALVVHAKHGEAQAFYERLGFEPSPTDPLHLYVLLKDLL